MSDVHTEETRAQLLHTCEVCLEQPEGWAAGDHLPRALGKAVPSALLQWQSAMLWHNKLGKLCPLPALTRQAFVIDLEPAQLLCNLTTLINAVESGRRMIGGLKGGPACSFPGKASWYCA